MDTTPSHRAYFFKLAEIPTNPQVRNSAGRVRTALINAYNGGSTQPRAEVFVREDGVVELYLDPSVNRSYDILKKVMEESLKGIHNLISQGGVRYFSPQEALTSTGKNLETLASDSSFVKSPAHISIATLEGHMLSYIRTIDAHISGTFQAYATELDKRIPYKTPVFPEPENVVKAKSLLEGEQQIRSTFRFMAKDAQDANIRAWDNARKTLVAYESRKGDEEKAYQEKIKQDKIVVPLTVKKTQEGYLISLPVNPNSLNVVAGSLVKGMEEIVQKLSGSAETKASLDSKKYMSITLTGHISYSVIGKLVGRAFASAEKLGNLEVRPYYLDFTIPAPEKKETLAPEELNLEWANSALANFVRPLVDSAESMKAFCEKTGIPYHVILSVKGGRAIRGKTRDLLAEKLGESREKIDSLCR